MQSSKQFVDEIKEWANKFATRPDDIDELFYAQIKRMIEERDEAIREQAYMDGQDNILGGGY